MTATSGARRPVLPVDFVKCASARLHMFEEKREAVTAIEAAVLPLIA
jgi:hypothetical protein